MKPTRESDAGNVKIIDFEEFSSVSENRVGDRDGETRLYARDALASQR